MKFGYGNISRGGKWFRAHRKSYELFVGPIPEGSSVLHHCDNRACINPDHLFLGNQTDNMSDAARKGRTARGEKLGRSSLSPEKVIAIRADGRSHGQIAVEYQICRQSVGDIKNRSTWAWVQ